MSAGIETYGKVRIFRHRPLPGELEIGSDLAAVRRLELIAIH
jgi:hypothetical protein